MKNIYSLFRELLNSHSSVKVLREELCNFQISSNTCIGSITDRIASQLIVCCDRLRPLSIDGTHEDYHTDYCGCEDVSFNHELDDHIPCYRAWCLRNERLQVECAMSYDVWRFNYSALNLKDRLEVARRALAIEDHEHIMKA